MVARLTAVLDPGHALSMLQTGMPSIPEPAKGDLAEIATWPVVHALTVLR